MRHRSHLPIGSSRFVIVLLAAMGLAAAPLFAQNNSSATSATSSSLTKLTQAQIRQREQASAKSLVLAHWTQVANRNVQKLTGEYTKNAVVAWVGGPLNGTYQGHSAIDKLWSKFEKATSPMHFQVTAVTYDLSKAHPAVREDVKLTSGGKAIKVDSTLVYDNGKIMAEIWKVNA